MDPSEREKGIKVPTPEIVKSAAGEILSSQPDEKGLGRSVKKIGEEEFGQLVGSLVDGILTSNPLIKGKAEVKVNIAPSVKPDEQDVLKGSVSGEVRIDSPIRADITLKTVLKNNPAVKNTIVNEGLELEIVPGDVVAGMTLAGFGVEGTIRAVLENPDLALRTYLAAEMKILGVDLSGGGGVAMGFTTKDNKFTIVKKGKKI